MPEVGFDHGEKRQSGVNLEMGESARSEFVAAVRRPGQPGFVLSDYAVAFLV